jgi:hypothetical protein
MQTKASPRSGGGGSCNTPPPKTRSYVSIDTLEVGFGVVQRPDWDDVCTILDACKAAAGDPDSDPVDKHIWFGGEPYEVQASGASGGAYMAYVLRSGGFKICMMKRPTMYGETPNVRIEAGAMACLVCGSLEVLAAEMLRRVLSIGCTVQMCKVSRADVFADIGGHNVRAYVDSFNADRFVTRARIGGEYGVFRNGRRPTGFTIGRGAIRLRCYDKLLELQGDPVKAAAWSDLEWCDDVPGEVTRTEFQLRREALKSFGIDSLDDLVEKLPGVVSSLCGEWFRLTASAVDRKHADRAKVSKEWKAVQAAFAGQWGRVDPLRRVIKRKAIDSDRLLSQAWGCVESVAAVKGHDVQSVDDFIGYLTDAAYEFANRRETDGKRLDVFARVRDKRAVIDARYPLETAAFDRIT